MPTLVWLREDLRVQDNPALFHAAENNTGTIALYIIDANMWRQHNMAACRVEFILRGLKELSKELAKLNIPLLIATVSASNKILETITKIINQYKISVLYFNKQYEVNELERDKVITEYLTKQDINCYQYDDQTILPPGSVTNQQDEYFKVFTAYKRTWYKILQQRGGIKLFKTPKPQVNLNIQSSVIPEKINGFESNIDPMLWSAGEKAAHKKLQYFLDQNILTYDKARDFPAIDGTSKLSPYLSTGMISARACFQAAQFANHNELDTGNSGAVTWMNELIWRDFYKHILVAVPRVSKGQAYKLATENIPWQYNDEHFAAWCKGETGFPIIDAAMRQLNQTGWMHNRLRMVVAMFLAKNLLLDWRLGEKYFIQHLIDGDLAANNGGWQWSASTGTDAVPYFRIFNPISQSERFDPRGEFIRQYCPELAALDDRAIHDPYKRAPLIAANSKYPKPLVDLAVTRARALAAFKNLKV